MTHHAALLYARLMLRLFVAIELPDDVRASLAATMQRLRDAGAADALRWVRPESIHITLKFLGAVEDERVPALRTALRLGVHDAAPFDLATGALGSFGGRRNLRVVWTGVAGDTHALDSLAERVEAALTPLGFPRESRPFAAHLTLARVHDGTPPQERERIHALLATVPPPPATVFHVDRCSLMRSRLQRGGAIYDALNIYDLGGPER